MKDTYHTTQATATKLNVSVRTVYRLIEEGKLKSVKRGKSHFFIESDIDKLIKEGWQMKAHDFVLVLIFTAGFIGLIIAKTI